MQYLFSLSVVTAEHDCAHYGTLYNTYALVGITLVQLYGYAKQKRKYVQEKTTAK